METNRAFKRKWYDTLLVLYVQTVLLFLVGQIAGSLLVGLLGSGLSRLSESFAASDAWVMAQLYLLFIGIWAVVLLRLWASKKDRSILAVVGPKARGNNGKMLLVGAAIGFGLNAFCVLIAWLHKDIVLYFDSFRPLPLLALLAAVFIQSSAEELGCRGFLYQKLLRSYRNPAVAIIGNSLLFGILHLLNDGVTVLSFVNIVVVAVFFSLIVYYTDSLWCAFMAHTVWNYTQNIIFGLPNSGIVSVFSVFKLDAGAAVNSFAYNVGFGIEGTIVADVVLILATVAVYAWGRSRRTSADGGIDSGRDPV